MYNSYQITKCKTVNETMNKNQMWINVGLLVHLYMLLGAAVDSSPIREILSSNELQNGNPEISQDSSDLPSWRQELDLWLGDFEKIAKENTVGFIL